METSGSNIKLPKIYGATREEIIKELKGKKQGVEEKAARETTQALIAKVGTDNIVAQ